MKNIILLFGFLLAGSIYAQELDDIVAEVSTAIELDETQTKALATQMEKYTISLQLIFDKYEEAEPDPQAMLTDIKHAREDYEKALKNDIGKEKFTAYQGFVDQVKTEILSEAAGLRLLDLQEPLMMTDEQVQQMKPIMGKAMKGIMGTLMQYVDKPMNVRTKLKVGNSLKSIKKTMDKETAQVLTQEQIAKWEAMKEAAKEQENQAK